MHDADMLPVQGARTERFTVGLSIRTYNWRMRQRRKEMGLTQRQLAEMADTAIQTITMLETLNSTASVPWETIDRIATILDLSENDVCPRWLQPRIVREAINGDIPVGIDEADAQTTGGLREVVQAQIRKSINRALEAMPERQRKVLDMRYGLSGQAPATLERIASSMGITKDRVRQIEAKALFKAARSKEYGKELREAFESLRDME